MIDGRRSVYAHLRDLADISASWCSPIQTAISLFRPIDRPAAIHVFEFAKHLVELDIERGDPHVVSEWTCAARARHQRGRRVVGLVDQGFQRLARHRRSGAPTLILERPVLRTPEATPKAADAAFAQLSSQATRGRLRTFGRPQIRLGDSIRIKDVPDARLNGDFRVRASATRSTRKNGFRTEVEFLGVP